jgi:hypothetical protein
MTVLVDKVFQLNFLWVEHPFLNFKSVWLKNKVKFRSMESFHCFKVANAAVSSSWLEFLLDNLSDLVSQSLSNWYPWGPSCVNLFSYSPSSHMSLIYWIILLSLCPVFLCKISSIRMFIDNLFVPDNLDFSNFVHLDKDSFDDGMYPKLFSELHFTLMTSLTI